MHHVEAYEEQRAQGRQNFEAIVEADDRGEDVADQVLLTLLPYRDSPAYREKGAWIHIAPAPGDHKARIKSMRPEDWPQRALAILRFIRSCEEDSSQLAKACEEFSQSPYASGFQTGMLTPILHALRPDDFLIINSKPQQTINYFAGKSYGSSLAEYPALNAVGRELIAEVAEEMAEQLRQADVPEMRDTDRFDMFSHWLVAVKKYRFPNTRYWKIAPGAGAWQWEECRKNGFIAIGWEEMGDVSSLSRAEFDARRDELIAEHTDWNKARVNQVWTFARTIKEGDRIVANRGTSEVLGIGTVTGPYEFISDARHGHRLAVSWDDLTSRQVDEGGWRRTLIELDRERFESVSGAPPLTEQPSTQGEHPFSATTFGLLAELHKNPTVDFYKAHKEELSKHLEEPFQRLFRQVAARLPGPILETMETQKRIFARILKQFVQHGAWDFYWGAFYPKGGKRIEDAQLFSWINQERLDFGFYVGEYGTNQRERFVRNCKENRKELLNVLQSSLADDELVYGRVEDFVGGSKDPTSDRHSLSWEDWLKEPEKGDLRVAVTLPKEKVLDSSEDQLIECITRTFERLFPLILLTISDDPMPMIGEYLGPVEPPPRNPAYSLDQVSEETGFDKATLERWVGAVKRKGQAIVYGPPGTGKTYIAERLAQHLIGGGDGLVEIVQFHPEYAYEDFIQGIRPQVDSDGALKYPVVPGRFLTFCREARFREDRCVLIIDEINRANLSRVFGELMYLLEYRGREVPLAGGGSFSIPANVRVIGTMNTADRSIALVDHALRRRFAFLALYPDYKVLRRYHDYEETGFAVDGLIETLKKLNNQIGDRHYEVGITFFLQKDLGDHIEDIWQMEIEPYLEEYFFDQPDKVDQFRWGKVKGTIIGE